MTTEKISQLRKQLPLVKETLCETIKRNNEYEQLYKESMRERSIVQSYYTTLEIQLAELENCIQRPKATTTKKHLSIKDEKDLMERMLANLAPAQLQAVLTQLNIK